MPDTSPPVGARIALNNSLGTVRYVGPVDGTHGTWLGVEWDDPQRGKHDGCKDGKRYFRCATDHPTPASFIRPAAKGLSYGRSFLAALTEKYIDDSPAPSKEVVTLGSSHGLIQVEAVGLAKVRSNLADLARLVEVSLDGAHIAWAEQPPQVAERCPNIRGLDLSLNLLPSWPALATLTAQLPHLTRLALNSTRLALSPLPASPPSPPLPTSFQSLTELQLNATLTPWPSLLTILAFLPSLHTLEAGYNSLSLPSPLSPSCPAHVHAKLALLNLDTNLLAALPALSPLFPALTRLVLASNRIAAIPPAPSPAELGTLKHLSLSGNPLADWASVDNLRGWCPALEGLAIRAIPLLDDPNTGSYTRAFAIAKLPTLTSLDGAPITPKDRLDAELLYLSHITQHVPAPDRASWGRYAELVEKHGQPDEPSLRRTRPDHEKLADKLIQITLHLPSHPPTPLRILPTTPLRTFRLRVLKLLKSLPAPSPPVPKLKPDDIRIFLKLPGDGSEAELDAARDGAKEVEWLGLDEGAEVVVRIAE